MDEFSEIRNLIEPSIQSLGFDIVRLKWIGGSGFRSLQLMIEPIGGGGIKVEDCEKISHTVSAILDVEDTIKEAYRLEVSSPGIDRPLTRKKDFANYIGFEAKLETREPVEGRKRFRGAVTSVEEEVINFELSDEKKSYKIPFSKISEAKLLLTPELVEFATKTGTN
jgi:ribosome maturation factor RimP